MSQKQKDMISNAASQGLDKEIEKGLLSYNLASEIKKSDGHISITLTDSGVITFVKAMMNMMKESIPVTKFVPSGNSIVAITDNAFISRKELVKDLGMKMKQVIALEKEGRLTPTKFGGRLYYKKEELERLNLSFVGR